MQFAEYYLDTILMNFELDNPVREAWETLLKNREYREYAIENKYVSKEIVDVMVPEYTETFEDAFLWAARLIAEAVECLEK